MRFLPDTLLYTDTNHCLARLREWRPPVKAPRLPRIPVHFYWMGPLGAKQALSIKSFLATHDPALTECWLWLDTGAALDAAHSNRHLAPLLPLMQLKQFRLEEELRGTPFAGQDWLRNDLRPPAVSDIARLVILHNHGGLYADIDTLFLRDINELRACIDDAECGYQWSYVPRAANAFFRLHSGGPVIVDIMRSACSARSAHSNPMLAFDRNTTLDFLILPSSSFSPLWLRVDGKDRATNPVPFTRFAGFFRKFGWFFKRDTTIRSVGDFFPGAFAYHWHNLWDVPEHADSYAGLLDAEFNDRLRARHPGLAPLARFGITPQNP
jgi:hypothetical protein